MGEKDVIGPGAGSNYFGTEGELFEMMSKLYTEVGARILDRKNIYSRATFYSDAAYVIRRCIELEFSPFTNSQFNWEWWADELDRRAEDLGKDAQYAMVLPPGNNNNAAGILDSTNKLDLMMRKFISAWQQEAKDNDTSPLGEVTAAECAKITHRFVLFLEKWCFTYEPNFPGSSVMKKVVWAWVEACESDLRSVYRKLGEDDVAGGWGPGGGPIPPISWPGE